MFGIINSDILNRLPVDLKQFTINNTQNDKVLTFSEFKVALKKLRDGKLMAEKIM